MSFYFSTLEEYYIGGLFLGVGNGVTDGSVVLIFLFLYTGYRGNDVFKEFINVPTGLNSTTSIQLNYLLGLGLVVSQTVSVALK